MNLDIYIILLLINVGLQVCYTSSPKRFTANYLLKTYIYYMANFNFCSHTRSIEPLIYFPNTYHIGATKYFIKKYGKRGLIRDSFINIRGIYIDWRWLGFIIRVRVCLCWYQAVEWGLNSIRIIKKYKELKIIRRSSILFVVKEFRWIV